MAKKRKLARAPRQPLSSAPRLKVHHLTPQRPTSPPGEPLTPEQVKLHVLKMLLVADLLELSVRDQELEEVALRALQVLVNRSEHTLTAAADKTAEA